MPSDRLIQALNSVDWNANIADFTGDANLVNAVAVCNLRLAIWSKQFEIADKGNPAIPFVREMQVAGHQVAALTALALYKPAAAAMRTVLETSLYYTYFRTHPAELCTLARDADFYVQKSDILDYHKLHTPGFTEAQATVGLLGKLAGWYSQISAIVHGQIPGGWAEHRGLVETKHVKKTLPLVVEKFTEGETLVHYLFLCTAGRELWEGFSADAKNKLTSGLAGNVKAVLALDRA